MAKDYAKRVFTTTPRKSKKKRFRRELMLSFMLLIVGIVGYEVFKQRDMLFFAENSWLAHIKHVVFHKTTNKSQLAKAKSMTPAHVAPTVHFDFYNELPNMQVTLPESADASAPQTPALPVPAKKVLAYIVQFGVFKDEVGAGQLRLSLLLSGIEADIVNISTNSGSVFRVQSGPYSDQTETKKLLHQFQKKGIMGVIKQV